MSDTDNREGPANGSPRDNNTTTNNQAPRQSPQTQERDAGGFAAQPPSPGPQAQRREAEGRSTSPRTRHTRPVLQSPQDGGEFALTHRDLYLEQMAIDQVQETYTQERYRARDALAEIRTIQAKVDLGRNYFRRHQREADAGLRYLEELQEYVNEDRFQLTRWSQLSEPDYRPFDRLTPLIPPAPPRSVQIDEPRGMAELSYYGQRRAMRRNPPTGARVEAAAPDAGGEDVESVSDRSASPEADDRVVEAAPPSRDPSPAGSATSQFRARELVEGLDEPLQEQARRAREERVPQSPPAEQITEQEAPRSARPSRQARSRSRSPAGSGGEEPERDRYRSRSTSRVRNSPEPS